MSRFNQVASSSGVASDTLGSGSTIFCGSGTQLYDVPGALTPIYVCCNWTTPINGYVNIDVNFSQYDCIVVRGTSTTHCCNQSAGVMVLPSNACIDTLLCPTNYCFLNLFYTHAHTCGSCNCSFAEGCLCTGAMGCWNRMGYWEFTFQQGKGVYGCDCQCKTQGIDVSVYHTAYSYSSRKDVSLALGNRCSLNGYWPTVQVDSLSKLPELAFCKFVIRGSIYNCFTPLVCCCCEVCGAFFGIWGSPRSNPNVSAKDSAYSCG